MKIDMTLDELKALITEMVSEKLEEQTGGKLVAPGIRKLARIKQDPRSPEEVQASIERNRWTPPPGSKSSLELLREDRDR